MTDPAQYELLLRNIFRLVEDAELLLGDGHRLKPSPFSAMEEAGKYMALVTAGRFAEDIADCFKSAAVCEAFAQEMNALNVCAGHDDAATGIDPLRGGCHRRGSQFRYIETFVRRVLRNGRKMRSGAVDKADSLVREGQQSVHVNYDEYGQLSSDPLGIPEEQAAYWVGNGPMGGRVAKVLVSQLGKAEGRVNRSAAALSRHSSRLVGLLPRRPEGLRIMTICP